MDAFLPALISATPQLGVAGILLTILVWTMRSGSQDRADYRTSLSDAGSRHSDEVRRINADHDAELLELRTEVRDLRKRLAELELELDVEREARRHAEDEAAEARRRRGGPR